ncbi:MAG: hypothetical protein QXK65_01750 [Candidatus Micrarchaeaceae archaeon]
MSSKNREHRFATSFTAKAELKCSLKLLEATLDELPALKKDSYGSRLSYSILDGKEGAQSCVASARATFEKSLITYTFGFENQDAILYKRNLMMFMSLLAYVNGLYSVDFPSIYGYIIEGLAGSELIGLGEEKQAGMEERIDALNRVNVRLAHELANKISIASMLEAKVSEYEALLEELSTAARSSMGIELEALLAKLGINSGRWMKLLPKQNKEVIA